MIPSKRDACFAHPTAAQYGRVSAVTQLLADERVDPTLHVGHLQSGGQEPSVGPAHYDHYDPRTWSALLLAANGGHAPVVEVLLADGRVNPAVPNPSTGESAVYYAAAHGHVSVLELLLADERARILVNAQTGSVFAAVRQHMQSPFTREFNEIPNGRTPIHAATANGHADAVELLLGHEDIEVDVRDSNGHTAIFCAAAYCQPATAKVLLSDDRVDPNSFNGFNGTTPMMRCIFVGGISTLKVFLESDRVNPNLLMSNRNNALHCACLKRDIQAAELLIMDRRTPHYSEPFHMHPDAVMSPWFITLAKSTYDAAVVKIKRRLGLKFRGLVRAVIAFNRLRVKAAQKVYQPGGTGYQAASASFSSLREGTPK